MTAPTTPAPAGTLRGHEHYAYRILAALLDQPQRTAVTGSGLSLTAGTFRRSILSVALQLREAGARPGGTVAILTGPNHPHMLTIRYGAHLVGATAAYIRSNNARSDEGMLPAREQVRMLAELGAGLLVTDSDSLERGRSLCQDLPCRVVAADLGLAGEPGAAAGRLLREVPGAGYHPGSRMIVTYTSGSTGRPKGVCHSYRAWNNMAAGFEAVVRGAAPPAFLAVTPVGQTVGLMLDGALAAGGSVIVHERFGTGPVLDAISQLGVTDCYLAVPHLYALADDPWLASHGLGKLRNVIYSGSPAAPHRIAAAAKVFGNTLLQSYGSSEAGPITYLGPWEHRDPALLPTVGRPYPGVRVRVCDGDPGRELPAGRDGEVWVRSGNTMDEYLGDPELNARALRGGWLRTGDIGHLDGRGYLTLVGRLGQVIKNRGLKVSPAVIERALLAHPAVTTAAVIGVRHRGDIEEAYAAVTLHPSVPCTLSELRGHVGGALSPDQVPAVVAHWSALPADGAGKTDKRRLRALVEEGDGARHGLLAEE